ncbi:hypothetical protein DLAC_03240 [Tieghemostelium lacteum]|uniref:Phosphatidic acid phosphatase type 2/haloperoxidase domain-containing protein n=1 Tax=Tieghemostelium lacteum TaxID=361077 RepID=A0A152A1L0_TIELA|nr:hypothetical protein DLAC_03240 [Tieghemostelium lacteum]|eukprot:KYR00094.1 hypothetical protein DLAC_03240 [Tieghemostelium lacteum]
MSSNDMTIYYNETNCKHNSDFIICFPGDKVTSGMIVMAIFSYVPVVVFVPLFFWYLWKRSIIPLIGLTSLGFALILNELILKRIIKQSRPPESCACSFGMPSGHSMTSVLLLMWVILEFTLLPLNKSWTKKRRTTYILIAIAVFSVVPYSRVYLKYHTPLQVGVGCAVGLVLSLILYVFLRKFLMHKLPKHKKIFVEFKGKKLLLIKNSYKFKNHTESYSNISSTTTYLHHVVHYRSTSRNNLYKETTTTTTTYDQSQIELNAFEKEKLK